MGSQFFGGKYTTLTDIEALLSSCWIERLWTYQEAFLASNPVVVCGNMHIQWSDFEQSVLFLRQPSTLLFSRADDILDWYSFRSRATSDIR